MKKVIKLSRFLLVFLIFLLGIAAQDNNSIPTEEVRKDGTYANLFHFEFNPGKTDDALEILNKLMIPAYQNAGVDLTLIEDLMGTKDIFLVIPLKDGPAYYSFLVPKQDAEAWKQLSKLAGSPEKAEAELDRFIGFVKRQSQTLVFIPQKKTSFVSKLDDIVPDLLKKNNVPGLAVGLIEGGHIAFTGGYGLADVAAQRPMREDTKINVASISKPVTVWGAINLAESFKINLDEPIDSYLRRWKFPASRFDKKAVTLRRLLSHTAGISLPSVPWFPAEAKTPSLEQVLNGEVGEEKKPVTIEKQPGMIWSYSGGGYTIVELLMEEVSKKPFDEYMRTRVFQPLKMNESDYLVPKTNSPNSATLYDEKGQPVPRYAYVGESAAGLNTTVRDFARFLTAYIAVDGNPAGRNIISPADFKQIFEPLVKVELEDVSTASYGLGHGVHRSKTGDVIVYHSGGNPGVRAYFLVSLKTGNGMIAVANSDNGIPVLKDILRAWSEYYKTDIQPIY